MNSWYCWKKQVLRQLPVDRLAGIIHFLFHLLVMTTTTCAWWLDEALYLRCGLQCACFLPDMMADSTLFINRPPRHPPMFRLCLWQRLNLSFDSFFKNKLCLQTSLLQKWVKRFKKEGKNKQKQTHNDMVQQCGLNIKNNQVERGRLVHSNLSCS